MLGCKITELKFSFFQLKHFKTLKEEKLEPPKNVPTIEGIDKIVEKIERYFGRLKIHLVIGQNIA